MERYMDVEARFLHADTLLERGEIVEAKEILMEILEDEPDFGRAHNHVGWLYRAKLSDFGRAEYHLRLAVKFAPDYPGAYLNYGNLLIELREFEKLDELAEKAIKVRGIHKPSVLRFMAVVAEMKGETIAAMNLLRKAKDESLDEGTADYMKSEIRRVKGKMTTLRRIAVMF